MIKLIAIRAAIAVWVRAIRISDKLSPATWKALTCASVLLAGVFGWAVFTSLQPTRGDSTASKASSHRGYSRTALDFSPAMPARSSLFPSIQGSNSGRGFNVHPALVTALVYSTDFAVPNGHNWNQELWKTASEANGESHWGVFPNHAQLDLSGWCFGLIVPAITNDGEIARLVDIAHAGQANQMFVGSEVLMRHDSVKPRENNSGIMAIVLASGMREPTVKPVHMASAYASLAQDSTALRSGTIRPIKSTSSGAASAASNTESDYVSRLKQFTQKDSSVVLQMVPERSVRQDILFWTSIFSLVGSLITSIANIIFLWISEHRKRSDEILLRLNIRERDQEIEQLKVALEQAELSSEGNRSKLIIVPG